MTSKGYTVRADATTDEIVDGYLNLVNRQIQKGPRVFLQSAELVVPVDRSQGYQELKRKVEAGELLKPHQSTSIEKPDYYDSLFLDWGIQHFHLSVSPHPRAAGFVARSGPLLFARVTPTRFYAIQVYEHGAWNKNEIVEILERNWPSEIERFKLKGLHPITPPHSEQDIKAFRTAGITVLAQAGGRFIAPMGGGFRSNGQSSLILDSRANLRANCRELEEASLPILREFANHGGPPLHKQVVRLEHRADKLFVVEKSTNTDIAFADWLIYKDLE
ncbi:MAG: hypothetical protein RB191_13725 [Terriglobia bacterium]|nr:hypothetical protein [Terriglobia bacterium]